MARRPYMMYRIFFMILIVTKSLTYFPPNVTRTTPDLDLDGVGLIRI